MVQDLQVCETFRWTTFLKGEHRYLRVSVVVGHKVYCFSSPPLSNLNDGDWIDAHVFNTVPLRWMKSPPVTPGTGERPFAAPSMCEGYTAVLIEMTVYIWGGLSSATVLLQYYNVLYAFDVDTHGWVKPEVSGSVPEAKCYHSACAMGKVMFIHGGWTQLTGYTNDIYKLDTSTMVWSLVNTGGSPSSVSACHSATIIGAKMFVFGGCGYQRQHYNDVRVFDTETSCWLSTPSAQLLPEGRQCHSAFAYNGELYVFGGFNSNQISNDLWKIWRFNPETFSWKEIEPNGKGDRCQMFWTCCCLVEDRIIVFIEGNPDEVYVLDLCPSLKTLCKLKVIQGGLERSELPRDIRWELSAMTSKYVGPLV